jgi:porin
MRIAARLAGASLMVLTGVAGAQSPDPEKTPVPVKGMDVSLIYDGELVSDVSGGEHRGSIFHGSLQAQAAFDLGELFGWRETTASLYGMLLHGARPESLSGAAQGVSSISGKSGLHLDEAWIQRNFDHDRFSFLAGLYDLNSEFYRARAASLLINPSFGVGPEFSQSGPASVPAFPNTSLAMRVQYKFTPGLVGRAAVLDAQPFSGGTTNAVTIGGTGALVVGELAYVERPEEQRRRAGRLRTGRFAELAPYQDKYAVGLWHYTATFQDLSTAEVHHGSNGAYLLVDRLLTRTRREGAVKASSFLQLGLGDERVNRFGSYVGTGVHVSAFSQARPKDEIAVAIAWARNGSHYMTEQTQLGTPVTRAETIFEVTYLLPISDAISLQPDVQYIVHPNTDPALGNALNLLLRFEVTF